MPARGSIYVEATPEPALVAQAYFATAQKLRNMEEPLQYAARIAADEVKQNFDAQGRPTGWAPLSEATLARRIWGSLSDTQKVNFIKMKEESQGQGSLTFDEGGNPHFIPSNSFAQVLGGLASGIQILVDTGDLEQGATSGSNFNYRTLSGNEQAAEMEDPTGYGTFHITGTSKNLPIRDWSYISSEGVDQMSAYMADWVVKD
jgi:phage gpG-like protein